MAAAEWAAWVEWAAAISIWIDRTSRLSTLLTNGLASKEAGLFYIADKAVTKLPLVVERVPFSEQPRPQLRRASVALR